MSLYEVTINPEEYPNEFGTFLREQFGNEYDTVIDYDEEWVGDEVFEICGKKIFMGGVRVEVIERFNSFTGDLEYWFPDGSHLYFNVIDDMCTMWDFYPPEKEKVDYGI